MNNRNLHLVLTVYVLASSLLPQDSHATNYSVINTVPNTPGGQVLETEIGVDFTLSILPTINQFIFKVFEEFDVSERRDVPDVNVYISEFPGYAYASANNINLSASALDTFYYPRSQSKSFFTSLMYHEMAHVFQWHAEFACPFGLLEGIADYVMIKSGSYNMSYPYTNPGAGKRWDEGYGVTERFLEYCDSLLPSFTAKLNKKTRERYSDAFFVELLGKPVGQLWIEYKAKYGNQPDINTRERLSSLRYCLRIFPMLE